VLDLARAIRSGTEEHASGELALHVIDVMVSITDAAESGTPVEIGSTAPKPTPLPEDWDPSNATL
jgi:predicted dehydrogenase